MGLFKRFFKRIGRIFGGKAKHNGDFVRHRRYRLTLVNLSSMSTMFEFRARKWGMILMALGLFVLSGLVFLAICLYTPLRNILPVRMQSDLREEYAQLSERLDSANVATAMTNRYAENILRILSDTVGEPATATEPQEETLQPLPLDSLMSATEAQRAFVRRFEDQERFNLSVLSPIAAEGMVFYPPIAGLPIQESTSESGIPYIKVQPNRSTPVSAVYRGTVLSTYFTTGNGITVIVQHPNEFVSVYSGLADTFVARGEKVNAGTRIGVAMESKYPLRFELWHNGVPLPAAEYIAF